jgi:hypothetical protein
VQLEPWIDLLGLLATEELGEGIEVFQAKK